MNNYKNIPGVVLYEVDESTLWIQFDHEKDTNPFSRRLTVEILRIAKIVEADDSIKSVILTGGEGRSFCAGGDFNDVQKLKERDETHQYLWEIIDLYQAILNISKPVVSLIDHYAIGQGLQVALMTDYRIATSRAQVSMPELKNGVACPLGATILQCYFGHAAMLEDVIGCAMLSSEQALQKKYFNQICASDQLFKAGKNFISRLNAYPAVPYQTTKKIFNKKIFHALEEVRGPAAHAHAETVLAKTAQTHFKKILGRDGIYE